MNEEGGCDTMRTKVGKRGVGQLFLMIILAFLLIISFYPILWMFLSSFKSINEIYQDALGLPSQFNFNIYREAIVEASFFQALGNSVFVTVLTVAIILVLSSLAAFAFAILDFKFKEALYMAMLAGQVVSAQIILIPLFTQFKDMGILNTRWSVICAYAAIGIPLSMLLLRNSFQAIPREIYESAKTDGSSNFRYYTQFVLPLSKPGLASVLIYQTLFAWNEYLLALTFLNANATKTLPLVVTVFVGRYAMRWDKVFAVLTLSVVPILILYLFLQKYFIRGLMAGAVKG